MVRFLRNWLVWILAGLMLACIAITLVSLSNREETRAKSELTLLMTRAFEHINAGEAYVDPVISAEEESLMSKAHAIVRFLEHDDALLETDALATLCEQLEVDRIDVSNLDGELIASSERERIGLALGKEEDFAWTMAAADDPSAALMQTDASDKSLLFACAGRTDIDGFVLLTRDDPFVDDALEKSSAEALLSQLSYSSDLIFESTIAGADGTFYDAGSLCVRKTENGVTLIAARASSDVFRARNAALAALGIAVLCIVICGVATYLLQLEPVVVLEEQDEAEQFEQAQGEAGEDGETINRTNQEQREIDTQHKRAEARAPRQVRKNGKKKQQAAQDAENGEEPFEQIVE